MKKLLAIVLAVGMVLAVFAACSKEDSEDHGNESVPESVSATELTTDDAKITENDAIEYIKSYTPEELSLTQEEYDTCSFMVNTKGKEIDGDYYIFVIATVKNPHNNDDGSVSYTFDNKGEYFIRYDGKQVLKKDMTSEEEKYEELTVKELPETTAAESEEAASAAE